MSSRRHIFAVALISLMSCLFSVSPAGAAEGYVVSNWAPGGSACNAWGGGQTDERGYQYVQCANRTLIYDPQGVLVTQLSGTPGHDVAPAPDGSALYFINSGNGVVRWVRDIKGKYIQDTVWKLDKFQYGIQRNAQGQPILGADGKALPRMYTAQGFYIATDSLGDLYVSNGTWQADAPSMIIKFRPTAPAGSQVITSWGEYNSNPRNTAASWALGRFLSTNTGVAVSRDGKYVYTTEMGNNRVQRFTRMANGKYLDPSTDAFNNPVNTANVMTWGANQLTDPLRLGSCDPGKFGAPYDINVDGWGYVYVQNTTCEQVQKFTFDGQYLGTWAYGVNPDPAVHEVAHGISVNFRGDIMVGERSRMFTRTTATPAPAWPALQMPETPDTTAPVLASVTAPSETTSQTVTLALNATDNRAVTKMKFANENGDIDRAPWVPFAAQTQWQLSAGYGSKAVFVVVRDEAGNDSNLIISRLTYKQPPAPVNAAPVLNQVTLPAETTTLNVAVTINATDDTAVTQMRIANDHEDIYSLGWTAFTPNATKTLFNDYGTRGMWVQVRDAQGLESDILYRTTRYVREPVVVPQNAAPVLRGLTIPAATTNQTVAVAIDATDDTAVTQMRIAHDHEDLYAQPWIAFSANTTKTLFSEYGTRGMWVQVRDAQGLESEILYRTTRYTAVQVANAAPVLREVTMAANTASQVVEISIDATDDVGVVKMRLANEDEDIYKKPWVAMATPVQHLLSVGADTKGVFVQVQDARGAESDILFRKTRCVPCTPPAGLANVIGNRFANRLAGTVASDRILAGAGNDTVHAEGAGRDYIDCGAGRDVVYVNRDAKTIRCERVIRVSVGRT